jgi:hypothetical protein
MTTPKARFTLALAAVLLLIPVQAGATLAEAKSFDDKVENAAAIVIGKCVATESRWDPARKWILTYNRFAIEKSLKGNFQGGEVTIVTPGGIVGNIQQDTVGIPKFDVGNEHVLFVKNTAAGPTVLYFEQGSYELIRDQRGDRTVIPAVSSAVLIDTQAGRAVAPEEPTTLRAFEGRVRETIKRRDAIRMEMIEREKRERNSLISVLQRNKALVLLALVGAVLATWQLVKRW